MAADAYPHPLTDFVCQGKSKDLHSFFEQSVQNLLKESSEKFKGWLSTPGPLNTELSCKKVRASVWRGAWDHVEKSIQDERWVFRASATNSLVLVLLCKEGSATPSLARAGAERWAALGWRVLCAQQRAHRIVVSRGAGYLCPVPL